MKDAARKSGPPSARETRAKKLQNGGPKVGPRIAPLICILYCCVNSGPKNEPRKRAQNLSDWTRFSYPRRVKSRTVRNAVLLPHGRLGVSDDAQGTCGYDQTWLRWLKGNAPTCYYARLAPHAGRTATSFMSRKSRSGERRDQERARYNGVVRRGSMLPD